MADWLPCQTRLLRNCFVFTGETTMPRIKKAVPTRKLWTLLKSTPDTREMFDLIKEIQNHPAIEYVRLEALAGHCYPNEAENTQFDKIDNKMKCLSTMLDIMNYTQSNGT
jgi:hypothetical protein